MKKIIMILFLLSFTAPSLAMTVGSPDMSIPEEVVNKTLDRYEYNMSIKAGMDIEIITKRDLASAPADVGNAELEGHSGMFKFSNNFNDIIEPYIKIGSSNFEVKWNQFGNNVKVEAGPDFVWGVGAKAKIWEFKNYGVKLTLDVQYRKSDLHFDKAKIGGSKLTASAKDEKFEMTEWQTSLLASKKIILPIGTKDYYIVPYVGLTHLSLVADVQFHQGGTEALYSTFDASDENEFGIVLGCDIMPFFLSYYLLNFELRLINETAFSLGGTIKF